MVADIHAHLDYFSNEELKKIIERAKKEGIEIIITNSTDIKSCKKSLEISKKYDIVRLAVGLYPNDNLNINDFDEFKKFVLENQKEIFAIGEIGMDFKESKNEGSQELIFKKQLELAQELNLPVIIHSRKAEKEVLKILEDYKNLKKILHCFSGKFKLIEEAKKQGCYFSIPANINRSEHFKKMVKEISMERILLETDSPFLPPTKGETNEPANVLKTVKTISAIWGISYDETENILEDNFRKVFE